MRFPLQVDDIVRVRVPLILQLAKMQNEVKRFRKSNVNGVR